MHQKNIEIEGLKREITRKDEEEMMNKFKLVKINENLQGKLRRLQTSKGSELEIAQSRKKEESNQGVQASFGESKGGRRVFKIRTQHSQSPFALNTVSKFDYGAVWK